ncbi:MAG: ComEC/Rec2 family competence protein, partial [Sporichthyaceae bacterium]|nr:ComEC/Rec2 family competence protein [Sporichthyaceae bacterium]
SALQRVAGALRAGLRRASGGLPTAQRGLLPGLVIGDTSRVPSTLADDFRTAGLTHLTAVSGANLAIVTGFVLLLGRNVGVRGRALPLLAAVAMVGFVVLARPQPSVVRAAAMGAVALSALASGRRRRSLAALGVTVVVLLLLDPWLSRSYGFVLSVLATGALVLLAPRWARAWQERGLPAPLAQALAVPLAAQLVCAPVVAMLSGQVSLVAVPANLLVAPVIAPATVLGVMATVASSVHQPTATALAWLAGAFVWWVVVVARWAAGLPWAATAWPASLSGALLLTMVTAAAVLLVRHLARRPAQAGAVAVVLVVAVAVPVSRPGWPPRDWAMAACDVGQGDALVLAAGDHRAVVVDAGPDPALVDRCLDGLGVTEVVAVVLTHLHADHVEGLPGVLRRRVVGEVQVGLYDEPSEELDRVRGWTAAAGVPLTRAAVGDRARTGPVSWEVVWPDRVIRAGSLPNNASTVLLVRAGAVRVLLTGDVEPEAQRALVASGRLQPVDVLKVAHHGSRYQAPELLSHVRPQIALVSVGQDNDYGHPAKATLSALRTTGALLGRTDRDGTLVVAGHGRSLRLVTAGR